MHTAVCYSSREYLIDVCVHIHAYYVYTCMFCLTSGEEYQLVLMESAQNQSSEISHFRICLHILKEHNFHDIVRAKILQSLP